MGTAARHRAKGITLRDTRLLPTTPPAMVLQPRLVSHPPPAPKHHPGRGKEGSTCVPSPPGHPESAAGQSQLLGRAHLEAAGVPVVPGTFGLLLLLCGGKAGGKSLQGSWRSHQPAKRPLNPAMLPAHPSHHHQSRGTGLRSAPSRRPHSPASQELGPAGCTLCHVPGPPWGLGTPTLVLQGLQSLLSLVVQLLQVRRPRGGEEDVVGAFLARRILHAQPLLSLALGSACGDRGVSLAGGDTATFPPMHPHP